MFDTENNPFGTDAWTPATHDDIKHAPRDRRRVGERRAMRPAPKLFTTVKTILLTW